MHPILNIAVRAARKAGDVIMQNWNRIDRLRFKDKGIHDYVTEVDLHAEQAIVEIVHTAYPDHSVLSEEGTIIKGNGYEWIIDPLDGTTNYMHRFPQFSVSIAVRKGRDLEHAVVYDPHWNELYTASRGSGAHLNEKRIRASNTDRLQDALVGTGFPYREPEHLKYWVPIFEDLARKTSGIRRPGSAALDLAYVACGRYDAFWEMGLKSWDVAAGALLIQEAGGMITDFQGREKFLETGEVIASGSNLFTEFQNIIQRHVHKIEKQ